MRHPALLEVDRERGGDDLGPALGEGRDDRSLVARGRGARLEEDGAAVRWHAQNRGPRPAEAGIRLRELVEAERDVSRWLDVLPLYAGLQADLAGAAADLLALGAPDLRLAVLSARYEALLDELDALDRLEAADGDDRPSVPTARPSDEMRRLRHAVPRVAEMCTELAGYGIAETFQHDDLNDGAVYARDGRYLILDWGDACVSHPFFSMSVTLEGVIGWGVDDVQGSVDVTPFRDAYLAPFAGDRTGEELRAACALALRLGWVCRAVNGHVSGMDAIPTWTRLRMFLDGHARGTGPATA